jgi:hypothetical protein
MGMEETLEFWIAQLRAQGKELHPDVVRAAHSVLPDVVAYGHQDPIAAVELLAKVASQVSSSVFKGRRSHWTKTARRSTVWSSTSSGPFSRRPIIPM